MLSSDSSPGLPFAPPIHGKEEKKRPLRSSSWIPPEILKGDYSKIAEDGGGDGPGGLPTPKQKSGDLLASSHVLRTRSAEELEHYRMTAGILDEPYRDVNMTYELSKVLGEGSSGIIHKCIHKETGIVYACKTIFKSKLLCPEAVDDVQNEVKVMKLVGRHPCILELKETFEDHYAVHLILELCNGGDLYDRIQDKKQFSEMEAARVCRRLLSAVHHFHSHGYMHRDIKPENILLVSKNSNVDIRVADFGQSVPIRPGKILTQTVGSVFYVAPEILNKSYNHSADIWSVGIILYILLSGKPPFVGPNRRITFDMIKNAPVDVGRESLKSVSADAKDLILRMLDRNPETRITASQAKLHPWMMKYCPTVQPNTGKKVSPGEPSPMSTLNSAFSDFNVSPATSVTSSPSHHHHRRASGDLSRGSSGDYRHMLPAFARLGHGLPQSPTSSPPAPRPLRSYASLPAPKRSGNSPLAYVPESNQLS